MTNPIAAFLSELVDSAQAGYDFRRRRTLDDELLNLRRAEGRRADTRARREDLLFQRESGEYDRARNLRREVGTYLQAPVRHKTLGSFISGQPGSRNVTLSEDATLAQNVGRALGRFSGRSMSDEEALLAGSGMVPASALQPRRYQPSTRAEWLADMRAMMGARAGQRLPITMDQALKAVDRIYGVWDETTQSFNFPTMTPAQRYGLANKIVSGAVTDEDFPAVTPALEQAPTSPEKPGWLKRMWRGIFGGGEQDGPGTTAPATTPRDGAATRPSAGPRTPPADRFTEARDILRDPRYAALGDEGLRLALQEAGYTDDEIDALLSDGTPVP